MKNSKSPFRVMLRVASYSALLSMALIAYLFVTSSTQQQFMLTAIVAVLLLLLSMAVGFYFGMRRYYEKEVLAQQQVTIHYPARAQFEHYADVVDANVNRLYRKDGRYA